MELAAKIDHYGKLSQHMLSLAEHEEDAELKKSLVKLATQYAALASDAERKLKHQQ
jgi:hypothetical protein